MDTKVILLWVCMVVLIVSFLAQIASIASDGWLVMDDPLKPYTYNFGLYYVNYCEGDNCTAFYIKDVPNFPLGVRLDKYLSVFRVGTALAAALTFLAVIFLSRLTTQCCANCQTCAGYDNHLTCLHSFTLAAGLLATMAAAHMGTDISTISEVFDIYSTPYSLILTGIGGILALVVFFLLVIMYCRHNDVEEFSVKHTNGGQKYISPDEYFDKTEAYVNNHAVPAPPQTRVVHVPRATPPAYSSSRGSYSEFMVEQPRKQTRRVEYVEEPHIQSRSYQHGTKLYQSQPNVFHVTMT